jgi:hypothetical protein
VRARHEDGCAQQFLHDSRCCKIEGYSNNICRSVSPCLFGIRIQGNALKAASLSLTEAVGAFLPAHPSIDALSIAEALAQKAEKVLKKKVEKRKKSADSTPSIAAATYVSHKRRSCRVESQSAPDSTLILLQPVLPKGSRKKLKRNGAEEVSSELPLAVNRTEGPGRLELQSEISQKKATKRGSSGHELCVCTTADRTIVQSAASTLLCHGSRAQTTRTMQPEYRAKSEMKCCNE